MEKTAVQVRNVVIGQGRPKICVPLVAGDLSELERELALLEGAAFDLAEFRADAYRDPGEASLREALTTVRRSLGDIPILFTLRTSAEGGAFAGDAEAYEKLLLFAAREHLADLVDVELRTPGEAAPELVRNLREQGVRTIGSWHDFEKTPPVQEMVSILRQMQQTGMDITKLAVMPRDRRDVLRLMDAALQMEEQYADRPCITMAMGEYGKISRIAGGFTGSALTFAAAGRASAPGQMETGQVRDLLERLEKCGIQTCR